MLSPCLRKVSWSQITAEHFCMINRSNLLIFAFNPWQFHWIIFRPMVYQFGFMFCLRSFLVWLVCWFPTFGLLYPFLRSLWIYSVSSLVLFLFLVICYIVTYADSHLHTCTYICRIIHSDTTIKMHEGRCKKKWSRKEDARRNEAGRKTQEETKQEGRRRKEDTGRLL